MSLAGSRTIGTSKTKKSPEKNNNYNMSNNNINKYKSEKKNSISSIQSNIDPTLPTNIKGRTVIANVSPSKYKTKSNNFNNANSTNKDSIDSFKFLKDK